MFQVVIVYLRCFFFPLMPLVGVTGWQAIGFYFRRLELIKECSGVHWDVEGHGLVRVWRCRPFVNMPMGMWGMFPDESFYHAGNNRSPERDE